MMVCIILCVSCAPKEDALYSLEKFSNRIENSKNWTVLDWDDAAQNFDEICQTLEKYNYSEDTLLYIDSLKKVCYDKLYCHYKTSR